MVDRYRVWLGAGVLAGGVSAAMLAGAGIAAADDGSASSSGTQRSSGSGDSDSSTAGPESKSYRDKPSRASRTTTESEASTGGRDQRRAAADSSASDSDDSDADADDTQSDDAESDDVTETETETEVETETETEADSDAEVEADDEEDPAEPAPVSAGKHRAPEVDAETSVETDPEVVTEAPTGADEPEQATEPEQPAESEEAELAADSGDPSEVPTGFGSGIELDSASDGGSVVMQVAAASVPGLESAPSELLMLFNSVGTLVYNFYTSTMQFLAGPLRAPFGSSVRAERSTLTIGNGVEVSADWYFPDSKEPPAGLVYLQHGFLATASFYNATAAYLAEKTNSIVVAPTLTWNIFDTANYPLMLPETHRVIADLFAGDRAALHASAQAAGFTGTLPTRLVLTGHSAGGGLVAGAAGYMSELGIADDLAGVVMLDGAGHLDHMSSALAKIPHSIPVYNLAAEPDSWNTYGDANLRLAQARPGMFTGVVVDGGRHSDSMQSSNPLIQFAAYLATGFSSPLNVTANEIFSAGWINDMLHDTHTTKLYGTSGSTLSVVTGWWRASAQVVPVKSHDLTTTAQLFACLLNPTSLNCTSLPFWNAPPLGEAPPAHRDRTFAA